MEIIQSFLYSITRVKLSLYEQRILTKVVEHAQQRVKGLSMSHVKCKLQHDYDNVKIEIPIKYLLNEGDKHYDYVYKAMKGLVGRNFDFYDPRTKNYYTSSVIYNARHSYKKGTISFYVSGILFDVLLDFTCGYKSYDLEAALTLNSPYSVRMYVLLNNQEKPITWSVEKLKAIFGVENQYSQTADFIKRIIEPSRKELLALGVNSFTYSRVKSGQKVTALQFFPVKSLQSAANVYGELSKEQITQAVAIRMYLMEYVGFTSKECDIQKKVIEKFAQIPDAVPELATIDQRAKRARAGKGYYINAMKKIAAEILERMKKLHITKEDVK